MSTDRISYLSIVGSQFFTDERKSIIITSQYPPSAWYDMVGDPTVADAILDRIVHSAHIIELSGESMRKLKAKK